MIDRFLTRDECRELALKWRVADGSPLSEFARAGVIAAACLDEVRALYAKPLAPEQRAELMRLGMALAAFRFEHDARTYDALLQASPEASQPEVEKRSKRK